MKRYILYAILIVGYNFIKPPTCKRGAFCPGELTLWMYNDD